MYKFIIDNSCTKQLQKYGVFGKHTTHSTKYNISIFEKCVLHNDDLCGAMIFFLSSIKKYQSKYCLLVQTQYNKVSEHNGISDRSFSDDKLLGR